MMKRTTKTLVIDPNFIPCPVNADDEIYANGIFEFNITHMLIYLADAGDTVPIVQITVAEFWHGFSSINEPHLESVDITRPVILAEIAPGRYNLIDGNHRAEKARRLGVSTIPAQALTVKQHLPFLTSKRAYEAYVDYWNSKLR